MWGNISSHLWTIPQQVQMAMALQASQVLWVTKEKQESRAEWRAAKARRVRRETEVFQVCILQNGIHLLFVPLAGVTDVMKRNTA